MDALNQHGTDQCSRFNDGTRPVCAAQGQLGHLCQPCLHQKQAAQALLGSESPRTRRMLLQRETQQPQNGQAFHRHGAQSSDKRNYSMARGGGGKGSRAEHDA